MPLQMLSAIQLDVANARELVEKDRHPCETVGSTSSVGRNATTNSHALQPSDHWGSRPAVCLHCHPERVVLSHTALPAVYSLGPHCLVQPHWLSHGMNCDSIVRPRGRRLAIARTPAAAKVAARSERQRGSSRRFISGQAHACSGRFCALRHGMIDPAASAVTHRAWLCRQRRRCSSSR